LHAYGDTIMRIYREFGEISNLKLNMAKTLVIPLWAADIHSLRNGHFAREFPSWNGACLDTHGTYLGFVLGPGRAETAWAKPQAKYIERAKLWSLPQIGLHHTALVYNTFVISVLSYVWQLCEPPGLVLDCEAPTLAKLVPGPFRWAIPSDLYRLSTLFGFPIDFKSIYCSALAAKGRVFCSEDFPFVAKARELDDLQYGGHSNIDLPLSWLLWFQSSYVRVICRAARACVLHNAPPKTLYKDLLAKASETKVEGAEHRARKQLQRTIYGKLVNSDLYPHIEDRVRHKIERWCLDPDLPGHVSRRLVHHLPRLGKLVAPRVVAAVLRTLYNGWCTARRFQSVGCCCMGCQYLGTDSIEHYARCPLTSQLREQLHLSERFHSLLGFLGGLRDQSDHERTLNSLVVFAVYSTVNNLRHAGHLPADQVSHMLMEYVKLGAGGNSYSLSVLHSVLMGSEMPEAPQRRRKRRKVHMKREGFEYVGDDL